MTRDGGRTFRSIAANLPTGGPDFVHVMVEGRIIRSGGPELALELEEKGYEWARELATA